MKYLLMIHALSIGGAERVGVSWANGLKKLGHDIDILTDTEVPITYTVNRGINIISQYKSKYKNRIFKRVDNIYQRTKQLITLTRKNNYDIIIKVLPEEFLPIIITKIITHIPVILTDHNSYERPKCAPMSKSQWFDKFILNRFYDIVTVLTSPDKDILSRAGLRNVEVLHNPLFLKPSSKENENKIVLAVGRIDAWHYKGFDILIKAWNKVWEKHSDWKLKIVGMGGQSNIDFLYSLADDRRSVEILPYTSDIVSYYREASIYCLSSRYEGWGLVLVEAMSQGCASVACDYKGRQAEIIRDGLNGILCPTENATALSCKIQSLIEDDSLRRNLQFNAPKYLDELSEINVAKRLEMISIRIVKV